MFRTLRPSLIAAALALSSVLQFSPANAEIVPPRTVELRELGPGSGNGIVFVDALQQASPWLSASSTPLRLDPEGNLLALEPGQSAERVVYTTERYPAGDYTLLFAGSGRFEVKGGTLADGGGPGRMVVHVPQNDGNGLRLRLTAMDSADPVRNVRLILPGFEGTAAAHPFYPAFVRSLQGATVLRFTAWMRAGSFAAAAVSPLRPRVQRPTQAMPNGAAVEYMTLLANMTGANPWFSVPVGATDGYVRSMSQAIKRTLDPSLHPLIQYADPNIFNLGSPVNAWAVMAGRNLRIAGSDPIVARGWYDVRSRQVLDLVRGEFGSQAGRVVSTDSTDMLRVSRGFARPNAVLTLGADASPFLAAHKPRSIPQYRPGAARPLAAKNSLDLAGRPGLAIGLGNVLPNADPERDGLMLTQARTAKGYRIIAPADATERVVRIYTTVDRAAVHLTATLEGKTYVSRPLRDDVESRAGVYTIVYRASQPGQRLVIDADRDAGTAFKIAAVRVADHDLKGVRNASPSSETIYHNDLLHTGWNPNETTLTTANVASSFGLVNTLSVDGGVLAQPLYIANYTLPSQGTHNILVVATENASVYEFDADTGAQLNKVSLGIAASSGDIGCGDIQPVYGVTSTPAIDLTTNTIYVVDTNEPAQGTFAVTLHALDIATLADKSTPVNLSPSVVLSNGNKVNFQPQYQYSRTSLVWANNSLYVGIGSHCDNDAGDIVGWLLRYDGSLNQLAALPTIEDNAGYLLSSIWMSGFAPAVSAKGDVYAVTGNGAFDGDTKGGHNFGESVIHVKSDLSKVADYFTPQNWQNLNGGDTDFGSGGVMLLPKQSGKYKQLAVAMGKASQLFLLNQNKLGHLHTNNTGALQVIGDSGGGVWGGPAYYSGPTGDYVFYQTSGDTLHAYQLDSSPSGVPSLTLTSSGSSYAGYGGCTPVVSSNGQTPGTGIVWDVERGGGSVTLEAYDASNLANLLFHAQAGTWPQSNGFVTPLVANGKVYVPAQGTIAVYGLTGK